MRGWETFTQSDDYYAHVYDPRYNEQVELILNPKEATVSIYGQDDNGNPVKLDLGGIENLRKKLQQAERFLKTGKEA